MRGYLFPVLLACCSLSAGCVERRFVITTDPPGAIAYDEKGFPMGAAPTDRQFVYYGKYKFTLVRDGYQTQVVEEQVKAPWYEWAPIDFISENVIPWTIRDIRRFHYTLQAAPIVPPESVLQQATILRERGLVTGTQLPLPGPPVPVDSAPVNPNPPGPVLMPPAAPE
ncbi:MAG: hypothetical protein HY040_04390 [Planctomycetes bacterium]|nr:hypothetical protein [Planctomycetota bacterium]